MTILRASKGLDPKAFKELYVYAYNLMRKAEGADKTVVLGAMSPKNGITMEENLRILAEHSETLSADGWTVLDLTTFQPCVEKLLSHQKIKTYPYMYLYDFSLPLITSGVFTSLHFRRNYSESHGTTFEHNVAMRFGIPVVYLD